MKHADPCAHTSLPTYSTTGPEKSGCDKNSVAPGRLASSSSTIISLLPSCRKTAGTNSACCGPFSVQNLQGIAFQLLVSVGKWSGGPPRTKVICEACCCCSGSTNNTAHNHVPSDVVTIHPYISPRPSTGTQVRILHITSNGYLPPAGTTTYRVFNPWGYFHKSTVACISYADAACTQNHHGFQLTYKTRAHASKDQSAGVAQPSLLP